MRLTDRQRAAIPYLLRDGYTVTKIADLLGVTRPTVYTWSNENRHLHDLPRTGRPRKLSPEQIRFIIDGTQDQRRRSTRVMRDRVFSKFQKKVHQTTVWRTLIRDGLQSFHRMRRPALTELQKQKRLEWCLANRGRNWHHCGWVDETHFAFKKSINVHNDVVWSRSSDDVPVYETVKYPTFIKCALFLSYKHCERSFFYTGKLDSSDFRDMVQEAHMHDRPKKWVQGSQPGQVFIMFDGDSAHKGEFTKWAKKNNLEALMLPPQSPDLDPAENFISIVNQRIDMEKLNSKEDLIAAIDAAILGVKGVTLRHLAMSMSRRVEAIIKANGGNIKRY